MQEQSIFIEALEKEDPADREGPGTVVNAVPERPAIGSHLFLAFS
jgi:hypothetical protein